MKYDQLKKPSETYTQVFVATCCPLDFWDGTRSFREMRESLASEWQQGIYPWPGRDFVREMCLLQVVLLNIAAVYEPETATAPEFGVAPHPKGESELILWGAIKISNNGTTFYASSNKEVLPREGFDIFVCKVPWFEFKEEP